ELGRLATPVDDRDLRALLRRVAARGLLPAVEQRRDEWGDDRHRPRRVTRDDRAGVRELRVQRAEPIGERDPGGAVRVQLEEAQLLAVPVRVEAADRHEGAVARVDARELLELRGEAIVPT